MSGKSILRGKVKSIPMIIATFNPKSISAPTIIIDNAPLPRGAVVYTLDGKSFIKTSDIQNTFAEIYTSAKPEWKWSAEGQSAWNTLGELGGLGSVGAYSAPSAIALSNLSILENNAIGAVIGTFSTTDDEAFDTFTYSIVGGDTSAFTIVNNQLKAAIVFDYENKSSYSITVRSTDSHGFYIEEVFNIAINQVIIYLDENQEGNNSVNKSYTQAGLKTITNISEYNSGKIYFYVGSLRSGYFYAYGAIAAVIAFTKNSNNEYTFSYINPPAAANKTTNENGTAAAGSTYPPVPNDFYLNITSAGVFEAYLSNYGVEANTFAVSFEVTDSLFSWELRTFPLVADASAIYSLAPNIYDNNLFEIINQNHIASKGFLNYEQKSTYTIAITKTKDSVETNEIKTIYVTDKNEFRSWGYFAQSYSEYSPTYVWSTAPSLSVGSARLAAAGTQNAALAFGGATVTAAFTGKTESFDGQSWSTATSLNTNRSWLAGCGTQTAALAIGGVKAENTVSSDTESFNGSVWTAINASPSMVARYGLACAGSSNNAVIFGGKQTETSSTTDSITEKFNGNAWSTSGGLLTARSSLAGTGSSNAAFAFGGIGTNGNYVNPTEKFNGSTWSASASIFGPRTKLAGAGTSTAAIGFGGDTTADSTTILFDGTNWTATEALTTMRYDLAGCGLQNSSLSIGGVSHISGIGATTVEKFNGIVSYANPENSTFLGYLGSLLDPDTNLAFQQNTYTLNSGGDFFEIKNGNELHTKTARSKVSSKSANILVTETATGKTASQSGYITIVSRPSIPDFSLKTSGGALVSTFSVANNQPTNTTVGWLWATDPDMWTANQAAGYGSHYFVIGNGDTSNFNIFNASNAGALRTSKPLAAGTYNIPIRVYDTSGLYKEKTVTIYVT